MERNRDRYPKEFLKINDLIRQYLITTIDSKSWIEIQLKMIMNFEANSSNEPQI